MSALIRNGHQGLWLSLAWILCVFTGLEGANYAYSGNNQVYSPSLYVLSHDLPGHMHTFGFLLLGIAFAFIYELKTYSHRTRLVLMVFCAAMVSTSVTIFGSWWITDKPVFGAPIIWLTFAAISIAMLRKPPIISPGKPAASSGSDDV